MPFDFPEVPDINFPSLTGDVEADAFSGETRIVAVGLDVLPEIAGLTVLGNPTDATGPTVEVTATGALQYLRVNSAGDALEWATISIPPGGSAHLIRENGVDQTQRDALNFLDSTSIIVSINDDAGNNETEIVFARAALTGDIEATQNSNATTFRAFSAKSVLANATNASAVPLELAGSGAFEYLRVNSTNTALEWQAIQVSSPITISSGVIGFDLAAIDSTSIVINSGTLQRAALTGDVTSAQNSNATAFRAFSAKSVLANATNASAVPTELAGSAAFQAIRVNAANTALEWAVPAIVGETGLTGTINNRALPSGFNSGDILAWTLSGNTTITGFDATGLSAGYEFILTPGTAAGLTVSIVSESASSTATNRIQTPGGVTLVLTEDSAIRLRRSNSRWFAETIGWPTASTSIVYSTDQIQRAALTGAIAATQNSNATLFSGIRVNGSATTDRTNINFISGSGITVAATDDAANDEIELTFSATAASITPTTISVFGTPTNTGVPFIIYVSFAAGVAGTADDVTVFSATAPFNFRILESWLVTSTAITSSTVQARTATGGGGSALSTAMSSTVTGKTSDNSTATVTVASGGSVFLRRSDRGVAGEFFAMCVRT